MSTIASRLSAWLWYLLPANPILVRVVFGMSRRTRHLWLRFGYLAILLAVVTLTLLTVGSSSSSLGELAKGASQTFMAASITQLALMCFLAPVFTAGAITQEKDAQTYNILLSTPLSNAQIVIGSLMSRLYFVLVLLLAGLPIFLTTMVYGGVTTGQVVRSFGIAGATAVLTGSLAITISMIRVGTRRTIFSFFLGIGIYLLSVYAVAVNTSWTTVPEAPVSVANSRQLSWLAAFHPFLALDVALNRVEAPDLAAVAHYGPLGRYYVAYPPAAYVLTTLLASTLLVVLSMFFVRRGTRQGEATIFTRLAGALPWFRRQKLTRKPHQVWANPVAWREAVTRASATSRGLGRYVVIGGGLAGAIVILVYYLRGTGGFTAADARNWLGTLLGIEFAIVLMIATNTAASALTKEKESKTLDLMLTTPLTSRYIIWGKLRGLVSFVVPLILVPVASLLLFAVADLLRRPPERAAYVETAVEVGLLLVVFAAYACMLGLHFSLKQKKTVRAVIVAVGVLLMVNVGAYFFWQAIVEKADLLGAGLAPATPFTAIFTLVDPLLLFDGPATLARHIGAVRVSAVIGTAVFLAIHAAIVYSWYKSMVRSFDMIIRKQSGT